MSKCVCVGFRDVGVCFVGVGFHVDGGKVDPVVGFGGVDGWVGHVVTRAVNVRGKVGMVHGGVLSWDKVGDGAEGVVRELHGVVVGGEGCLWFCRHSVVVRVRVWGGCGFV